MEVGGAGSVFSKTRSPGKPLIIGSVRPRDHFRSKWAFLNLRCKPY